ncbi:tRNA nucleotidyltransferase (CCA-adding enzyme) [Psychroflexus salarius]|uniref:tRNA nucleotidyltransferase (CCA-adding enzyme) n=1 Tax=Psychroflexus salarius TaxID=1155689 RepID=A0A1M4Y030_9FLAO|nr:HD domain-containing protein [Psychroflexus salarius]SHE98842.1 tRNA nucleotidyltransferase (CCA-adding enzyme) [Psychroflexus salarius]
MSKTHYTEALQHQLFPFITKAADQLGLETYVIGGFVRDYFLKREQKKDIDIVCVGDGIQLAKAVAELLPNKPKVQVFKTFGTAMLKAFDVEVEFVGARKESYTENSRKPSVEVGSLTDDQNRRDFTINALALQLNSEDFGKLLDPFDGLEHLKQQLIITPLDPDITFSDDPLRMLRAIRFSSQLKFFIDPKALDAIAQNKNRLQIISKERIVTEINKMMKTQQPSQGFKLLHKTGLLQLILPELTALEGIDEVDGQRHKDNFWHTLEVVDNISRETNNLWLRWAALLHDIGKAPTKKFSKRNGWTFHGHEFMGSKMVYKLFKRLKMPLNDKMKYVQKLVLLSSRPIAIVDDNTTDSAVRRLVFDAGDDIEDLMMLCEADITTKNPKRYKRYHNNFKIVRQRIKDVEERDKIRNFQPPISGKIIMNHLKIEPCKEVGLIKNEIKEAILEGEIPNEYDAAFKFMLKTAKAYGFNAKA